MTISHPQYVTPSSPAAVAARVLAENVHLAAQSRSRFGDVLERLSSYLENGLGITDLRDVTPEHVRGFVLAAGIGPPSPATMHLKRSAVRFLFREARRLGLVCHDPAWDLILPPRSRSHFRPLTDDEVLLCRSAAMHSITETRRPAAWALAEAGARSSEIGAVTGSDLDLESGRVWIPGGHRTVARWATPTDWGIRQLSRRASVRREDEPLVSSATRGKSAQASTCIAIADTLVRAGLGCERDVRPLSVAAWAGLQAFNVAGRIEDAARVLGMRSLDGAARLIGWDWSADGAGVHGS